MLPHYLVKYKSIDAVRRLVDHTHTTLKPVLVRATHLFLGEDYFNVG